MGFFLIGRLVLCPGTGWNPLLGQVGGTKLLQKEWVELNHIRGNKVGFRVSGRSFRVTK